ncbi:MAG: hypothetical protein LIR25_04110 [bacterium]|nr:hypothetical protein [Spirochaetales bacterium]MDT3389759.1 hypothetical protein [bacterium]
MSRFLNRKNFFNEAVCLLVLVCFVACNANFRPSFKQSITDSSLRSRMSRVIDAQLETVKDYLDEDLQARIDGTSRGGRMSGSEIVDVTMKESGGRDYLDFCYAVDMSTTTGDVDAVMDTARCILPDSEYQELVQLTQEVEREITIKGEEMARAIPLDQQAAFYKDLKTLVVRAIVLLAAGIVYACMPTVIFWGKISAACAISVGAGLVAITIMSLYEYFRFGTGEGMSFEDWFKDLIKIPQADFALTTAITTVAEAMGCGPVVTGIIICVFALYNIVDMVRTMLKTYNFDA